MRTTFIAMLLLSATAAFAGDPNSYGPSEWQDKSSGATLSSTFRLQTSPWVHDQMLGDALGDWLGVHNGRWDIYDGVLTEGGPAIGGTFKKGAAVILLHWHPGE
jgi:hypothetical protein